MKPNISKPQRKALLFAHDLMRGSIDVGRLPYVRGTTLKLTDGTTWRYYRHWIEPDCDPYRPFLSEDVFMSLVMMGYMETRTLPPDSIWVYRITRDGCDAVGRNYPLYSPHVMEQIRDRLLARRMRDLRNREQLFRRRGLFDGRRGDPRARGSSRHSIPFNYRARRR